MLSKAVKCGVRLALALTMGLALLSFLVIPAQAQSPVIDLKLTGEEAISWNISDIKPGDSSTKTVRLHNAGSRGGFVTIWISDVVSSESKNPESETGNTTEPGELVDYLVFALSCSRLDTNITLPAALHELPQSAFDSKYVKIEHLYAGEILTLIWQWEFVETGSPQNDAQGDSLSFTINYLLEELPPPQPGPEPSPSSYQWLEIDILGEITKVKISSSGRLLDSCIATDPYNKYKLELEKGAKVTCCCGDIPSRIKIKAYEVYEETLLPPEGTEIVAAYDFLGCVCDSMLCPIIFQSKAKLTLRYDPNLLHENTSSVIIASYDTVQGWRELEHPTGGIAETEEVCASISNVLTFAILAKLAPPTPLPPHFAASSLTIVPTVREIWEPVTFVTRTGESVTITANIANDGGQEGTYTVELKLNGETVDTTTVTLGAGQSQQVSFILSGMDYGQYQVEVAGLSGDFTVSRSISWLLIIGIIVAIGLIAWGVAWVRRKRKAIIPLKKT
jgi:hypothetical protein